MELNFSDLIKLFGILTGTAGFISAGVLMVFKWLLGGFSSHVDRLQNVWIEQSKDMKTSLDSARQELTKLIKIHEERVTILEEDLKIHQTTVADQIGNINSKISLVLREVK